MRIWDIPVDRLCRNHLLAEHRELHAIWSVIVNHRKGYSRHPEVLRWHGKLGALYLRHEAQRVEMARRGYAHRSPLNLKEIPAAHRGKAQKVLLESIPAQKKKLRDKRCDCSCRWPARTLKSHRAAQRGAAVLGPRECGGIW